MTDLFDTLADASAPRCLLLSDPPSGLRAVIAIDDLTLGPAAGGVRTRAYPSLDAAVRDAAALARAMTLKCALGRVTAGGGKAVVIDHGGLARERAFEVLGARIEELGGLFRTAGDLGTTVDDLAAMARTTRWVHTDERGLSDAVARGLLRCVEAAAERRGRTIADVRAIVQGCGAIGAAVARALRSAGADVAVCDIDGAHARTLAAEIGARAIDADGALEQDADVLCPCAVGGVVTEALAASVRAWVVCGAANNVLASERAGEVLHERGVLYVPDVIASAGAVVAGIGETVMGSRDTTELVDGLGDTARVVLAASVERDTPTTAIARELARARLDAARPST